MDLTNQTTTSLIPEKVSDPVDQIADILIGKNEDEEAKPTNLESEEPDDGTSEDNQEGEVEESEVTEAEAAESEVEDLTWADALGVDEHQLVLDEDGNLSGINVKVDGEVSTVKVKDLIAGYQLNKHITQKSQALAEEKREFDNLKQEAGKAYYEKLQTADKLLGYMNQALLKEYESVDWNQLRHQNPGEYAALQTEYQQRKGMLENIYSAIKVETNELDSAKKAEYEQRYQQHLKDQFERVLANNPSWVDQEVMKTEIQSIGEFANNAYGIQAEEFSCINDARYIEILKDAMAFRKGKITAEKKIQNAPKFQKANSKPKKPMSTVTRLTLNARKASGYKKRELQGDAIAALLLGHN